MMAATLSFPEKLWIELERTAQQEGKEPEALAQQFLREGIARRKDRIGDFIPWDAAVEIGSQHGRLWASGIVARKWVERENRRRGQTAIKTKRGFVHRDNLIAILKETEGRGKGRPSKDSKQ